MSACGTAFQAKSGRTATAFKFEGPFAFGETGIVLSVIGPLSQSGLGIFVASTFDGDHVQVKTDDEARARHWPMRVKP